MFEKDWSVFSANKKIIVYYDKNWFLRTTKIFKKETKVSVNIIKQGSENHVNINFYAYNLLYLTCMSIVNPIS